MSGSLISGGSTRRSQEISEPKISGGIPTLILVAGSQIIVLGRLLGLEVNTRLELAPWREQTNVVWTGRLTVLSSIAHEYCVLKDPNRTLGNRTASGPNMSVQFSHHEPFGTSIGSLVRSHMTMPVVHAGQQSETIVILDHSASSLRSSGVDYCIQTMLIDGSAAARAAFVRDTAKSDLSHLRPATKVRLRLSAARRGSSQLHLDGISSTHTYTDRTRWPG